MCRKININCTDAKKVSETRFTLLESCIQSKPPRAALSPSVQRSNIMTYSTFLALVILVALIFAFAAVMLNRRSGFLRFSIATIALFSGFAFAQKIEYEVWLVAKKSDQSAIPKFRDSGHAFIALVHGVDGNWQADSTFGFWMNRNLTVNKSEELEDVNKIIRHESISSRGFAVRKSRISYNRYTWIQNGAYDSAGCKEYQFFGGTGTSCNCMDYATRAWHVLSAKQDDFRIRAITIDLTLDGLVDAINKKNRDSGNDFLDSGKMWQ